MIYDVAVVGAGPAGSSAALALEKEGYNIILIDKEDFPRAKACAGVLPPRIFSELQIPENIVERSLDGYRIVSPSGMIVKSRFPRPGIIVRREIFDKFLLERLSCEIMKMRISDYISDIGHIKLKGKEGTVSAEFVVAADGANSNLRKIAFEDEKDPEGSAVALQYEIALDNKMINERIGNWFEVYYTFSNGYGWISPLYDAVKIGIGGISADFRKNTRALLNGFLDDENVRNKIADGEIKKTEAHRIPMRGPYEKLADDRILFCGDAGGFVFPGTGEGVFYAIKSGRLAAAIIKEAIDESKFDAEFLQTRYNEILKKNGLLSLRDVDFIEKVLSSSEGAESYLRTLKKLNE